MGVGVTIKNINLAEKGAWRPKWHPVTMTEHAGIGRSMTARIAGQTRKRRSRRRRRRVAQRRAHARS